MVLKFHSLLSNTLFKQRAVYPTALQPTAPWLVGNYSDRAVKRVVQASADGFEISDADEEYIFLYMTECGFVYPYIYIYVCVQTSRRSLFSIQSEYNESEHGDDTILCRLVHM